jgi:hypothetical protein
LVSRTRPTIAAVVAKQWRRVKADESYVAQSESQISNREYANAIPRERWKRTRPVTTRSTQDRPRLRYLNDPRGVSPVARLGSVLVRKEVR